MSSFFGLQIAHSALRAQQQVMETIAHNISNVATTGYTRQRVELVAGNPYPAPGTQGGDRGAFQMGSGVQASRVARVADMFVDAQLRMEQSRLAEKEQSENIISQVEAVFAEPGEDGLGATMAAFWSAWEQLSVNPESLVSRTSLLRESERLASSFGRISESFSGIQGNLDFEVEQSAELINSMAVSVAGLNAKIARAALQGFQPNDLIDSRDRIVSDLQQYMNVRVQQEGNGVVSLYVGNGILVQQESANRVQAVAMPVTGFHELRWETGGLPVQVSNGRIAAQVEMRDGYIVDLAADLDAMVSEIAQAVNTQHALGFDLQGVAVAGTTFQDFFQGATMATLEVNPALLASPAGIAASSSSGGVPGDAENARLIAGLKDMPLMAGSYTFEDYYRSVVARVGIDARSIMDDLDNTRILAQQVTEWRQSISGVSLDEEMVALQEAQRAYQAAARVISVMNEVLGTLIGMGTGR